MKTTKRILCLLMALALCLCMVLASCKKEPEPEPTPDTPPTTDIGDKKGQIHETEGVGGGATLDEPNDQVSDDETTRYN